MDKIAQTDVWDLAIKLSRGLIPSTSIIVTQTKNKITKKYKELETSEEWTRILSVTRSNPGIEANFLCQKANVALTTLIHMEEVDSEQLLLRVIRRGVARFYNIGDWGVFWLVIKDQEANPPKCNEKESAEVASEIASENNEENLKDYLKINNTDSVMNKNIKGPLNEDMQISQLTDKEDSDKNSIINKEIKSVEVSEDRRLHSVINTVYQ